MQKKYRKKPVVIEALQWDGKVSSATAIIGWVLDGGGTARYHEAREAIKLVDPFDQTVRELPAEPEHIAIDTLEGTMKALVGDFIIRGVQGEFYPCKPGIFAETYEVAE